MKEKKLIILDDLPEYDQRIITNCVFSLTLKQFVLIISIFIILRMKNDKLCVVILFSNTRRKSKDNIKYR